MAHAAHKVAVGGGYAALPCRQDAHIAAQAGAAGGRGDDAPGIDERLGVAAQDALFVDGHRGGDDDAAHALGDMLAFQHFVGGLHVLDAAVGAGANDDLVDLDVLTLFGEVGVLGQVRIADGRLQRGQVDGDGALILGVGVGLVLDPGALAAAFQVGFGDLIHREDAVFGTGFDCHVADAKAILHRQALDALTGELKALVQRARDADLADQVQNDILAGDGALDGAGQLDLDGGGHLEPGHALGHTGSHIGGAYAGGECADRTVGAGVAVRADDAVTGGHDALFGQQRMLNAHLADIVEVEDVVFIGELAALFGLGGAFDILIGHKMVEHDVDAGAVEHRVKTGFLKLVDRHRRGDIVAKHDIELSVDELARGNGCFPAMRGQDLLRHGHSHGVFPPFSS